jgi:hypothetical protein
MTATCARANFLAKVGGTDDDVPVDMVAGKSFNERAAWLDIVYENVPGPHGRKLQLALRYQVQGIGPSGVEGPAILAFGFRELLGEHNLTAPPGWKEGPEIVSVQNQIVQTFYPKHDGRNAYETLIEAALRGERNFFVGVEELHASWEFWEDTLHHMDHGLLAPRMHAQGDAAKVCKLSNAEMPPSRMKPTLDVRKALDWFYHGFDEYAAENGTGQSLKWHSQRAKTHGPETIFSFEHKSLEGERVTMDIPLMSLVQSEGGKPMRHATRWQEAMKERGYDSTVPPEEMKVLKKMTEQMDVWIQKLQRERMQKLKRELSEQRSKDDL